MIAERGVEGVKGLIKQNHTRASSKRTCQGHSLLLPSTQFLGPCTCQFTEVHKVEEFLDPEIFAGFLPYSKFHILGNAEVRE